MNRLESQHPDVYVLVESARLGEICRAVVTAVRASDVDVDIDWAAVDTTIAAGGDVQVSEALHAVVETIDDRAFDYADADDPRYDTTFAAARLAGAVAYACAPPSIMSVSDSLYEYLSASGDDGPVLDAVTRAVRP